MPAYRTIVVGTDGSATSLAAVDRARTAEERAITVGAVKIRTSAVDGPPVDVLRAAVTETGADLLVVGNKGLNTLSGRLLGSVPSDVARRSGVDVLIVHTT
jgi:nucleotide-binding universal stress UspA family protein